MAALIYSLCALTSITCFVLLWRSCRATPELQPRSGTPTELALLADRASDPARARLAASLASYAGARDAARVVHRLAHSSLAEGA